MVPFEAITRHFITFDHWIGVEPVGRGHINASYRIAVQQDRSLQYFFLQRLNRQVFAFPEQVMDNTLQVTDWLRQVPGYDLEVVAPVCSREGSAMVLAPDDSVWRLFPFLVHTFAPEQVEGPAQAGEAAAAFGKFFKALADFPANRLHPVLPGFHDTLLRWRAFESVLRNNPVGRAERIADELSEIGTLLPVFEQVAALIADGSLPLRAVHNDAKAGNVLLDDRTGRARAVIDLDTVMPGTVLSDFGDMVRTFTPNNYEDDPDIAGLRLREPVLQALCHAYLAETRSVLTAAERRYLPLGALWITGEQALRFLSDYLAGDVYYKIRYPEHNLIRARNQLALCRAIRSTDFNILL